MQNVPTQPSANAPNQPSASNMPNQPAFGNPNDYKIEYKPMNMNEGLEMDKNRSFLLNFLTFYIVLSPLFSFFLLLYLIIS